MYRFLIIGDFNIPVCCESKPLAKQILSLIDLFNLMQAVTGPTHEKEILWTLCCRMVYVLLSVKYNPNSRNVGTFLNLNKMKTKRLSNLIR